VWSGAGAAHKNHILGVFLGPHLIIKYFDFPPLFLCTPDSLCMLTSIIASMLANLPFFQKFDKIDYRIDGGGFYKRPRIDQCITVLS